MNPTHFRVGQSFRGGVVTFRAERQLRLGPGRGVATTAVLASGLDAYKRRTARQRRQKRMRNDFNDVDSYLLHSILRTENTCGVVRGHAKR